MVKDISTMTADSALKQIEEKNYDAKLLERGYKREAIQHYGYHLKKR